eukprot:CAMPEP_0183455172 /NCGR_PEP_ID=MMETSP0370-20130417/125964_1 /TAXON_ID=268820 /ORGANISM="Peridinium aciculiferum, Strain PAER-2" /LENGTH=31 /DNA_ID= /DNA_START= /DNA_END= /DNA_ORIENTATION=
MSLDEQPDVGCSHVGGGHRDDGVRGGMTWMS